MSSAHLWQPEALRTRWFRIEGGEHEGQLHLSGWMGSAIREGESPLTGELTWMKFQSCPLCCAMVLDDHGGRGHGGRDLTWSHEAWHARNDFPVPPELLTEADGPAYRKVPS